MSKLTYVAALSFIAAPCFALNASINESEIVFADQNSNSITVSVSGPNGFNASYEFNGSVASLQAAQINQGSDGDYNFDAVAVAITGEEYAGEENGRDGGYKPVAQSEATTGHFRLQDGSFVLTAEENN
ncbi:hypothetical protein ACQUQU_06100 [Thalassolituus sp. LLYu03]|uniref:hypothetical protein n=1 Tax=Thalassolituus sp. LLYu03 TaxID=3421656 RepID=UPI003D27E9D4